MQDEQTFELTADHVRLMRHFYVGWQDCEYGAPEINPKRPYGNSDVEGDICEILGWTMEGDDGDEPCWSSKQNKRAEQLHKETETALQIVLTCMTFRPGTYKKQETYNDRSWKLMSDHQPRESLDEK